MPYIRPEYRTEINPIQVQEVGAWLDGAGDINYVISRVISDYLAQELLSYARINEVIGALECAKLELYRRVAVPYEDCKKLENGDVYGVE